MEISRLFRHLAMTGGQVRRVFPPSALAAIEAAIGTSERRHAGEIRVAIEGGLHAAQLWNGLSARQRALQIFAQLGVWDTEHNNGVLIYVLLADRSVEVVVDRGLDVKAGAAAWEAACRLMETNFRAGRFEQGVLEGIAAITEHLVRHFPATGDHGGELPDAPVLL